MICYYNIESNYFFPEGYETSRDGFDTNAFHNQYDDKELTMTIIQLNDNYLFGIYKSVAWTSSIEM